MAEAATSTDGGGHSGGGLRGKVDRLVRECATFRGARSAALYAWHRALLRARALPLPLRGSPVRIHLAADGAPAFVRLGTSDLSVALEIFHHGEYAAPLALLRAAHPGADATPVIVDLGVNIGLSIRLWLSAFPRAAVVGVEPDAANLALAERNARVPGRDARVTLLRACAAGSDRTVALERPGGVAQSWGFRMKDPAGAGPAAESIPAMSIPTILSEAGVEGEIDLLKCDIEGAERELFETCAPWIGRVRAMVVELHAPYTRRDLLAHLAAAGAAFDVAADLKHMDGAVDVLMLVRRPPSPAAPEIVVTRREPEPQPHRSAR